VYVRPRAIPVDKLAAASYLVCSRGVAMPTVPLTDAFVKAVETKARESYHDEKMPGLMLRVTPRGIKTWAIWYRDDNQRAHLITLGRYPVMSLATAREVA
jgi:hypothetical protein